MSCIHFVIKRNVSTPQSSVYYTSASVNLQSLKLEYTYCIVARTYISSQVNLVDTSPTNPLREWMKSIS